ncbi:MAG: dihydroorotase [Prevotella sp.]
MRTLVTGAVVVGDGKSRRADVLIEDDRIADISDRFSGHYDSKIDATDCFLLPGIIDSHVHFREPGLAHKADIASESRAAAAGGVTSWFDMPNTSPQTTTMEALDNKFGQAASESLVNYSFFFGATDNNIDDMISLDKNRVPGVKLFMGSSTGNMLVDKEEALRKIFSAATLPVMAHCESTDIINENMARATALYGEDPDVRHHPEIRSEEACCHSTALALRLAACYGTRLHIAHVSTGCELEMIARYAHDNKGCNVTAEATVAHLLFCDDDYATLGTRIKCNPAVKSKADRAALRKALSDGTITTIATDHAPHLLSEKQGGCRKAASGMPMIQYSLVATLSLVDERVISMERLVELMCHNPARLFGVYRRGFIRQGYKADLVIVRRGRSWQVTADDVRSKCRWSPLEGRTFNWRVLHTFCNGQHVFDNGIIDENTCGEEIKFRLD